MLQQCYQKKIGYQKSESVKAVIRELGKVNDKCHDCCLKLNITKIVVKI